MNIKILRIFIIILCLIFYYFFFYGCGASGYGKFEFENEFWASHTCSGTIIYSLISIFTGRDWEIQTFVRFIYWPLNFYCLWSIWNYRIKITNFIKKIYDEV